MGTADNQNVLHGIVIPHEDITDGTLTAKDHATVLLRSAYTQAGPKAGPAVPGGTGYHMGLSTHSGEGTVTADASIEIMTQRAGHPIPNKGAGFVFRNLLNDDAADEMKGWDQYATITEWNPVTMHSTLAAASWSDCSVARMSAYSAGRGNLITTARVEGSTQRAFVYDPDGGTWTNTGATQVSNNLDDPSCILELPTGRIIQIGINAAYQRVDLDYSDDGGATWAMLSRNALKTRWTDSGSDTPACKRLSAAYSNGEILMLIEYEDDDRGVQDIAHYASIDLGMSFELIEDSYYITAADGEYYPCQCPTVRALPDSGFTVTCFVYDEFNSRLTPALYRLGTAYTPLTSSTPVLFEDFGAGTLWTSDAKIFAMSHCRDEDNVIYIVQQRHDVDEYKLHVYRSTDLGQSVEPHQLESWASEGVETDYFFGFDVEATGGRLFMVTRWVADNGSYWGKSVCSVCLGGYSAHTMPYSSIPDLSAGEDAFRDDNQLTWSQDIAETDAAICYLPTARPGDLGWTPLGILNESIVSSAELQILTAGVLRYFQYTTGSASTQFLGEWEVRLPNGGGDKTADDVSVHVIFDTGADEAEVTIRLEHDGYIVYDVNGAAALVTRTIDLKKRTHIRMAIWINAADGIGIQVWDCQAGHIHEYREVLDDTLTRVASSATTTQVEWGHRTVAGDTSYWRLSCLSMLGQGWGITTGTYNYWTNPDTLFPRAYSTRPQLVDDGIHVSAVDGPTGEDETWQIDADYEHPLWAIYPASSPSPSVTWRSTTTAAVVNLVWDLETPLFTAAYQDNYALALWLLGANFKTALLQGWTGAAWTTIATLNASTGYSPLKYARQGKRVRPDFTQTTTGGRYFFFEDHVGDTFALLNDQEYWYAKIQHNSEGAWRAAAAAPTTKTPTITLDEEYLDGTEPASGTGEVWRRNFGCVITAYNGAYSRFRLSIPVQDTADGYFELGQMVFGPVSVLGRQYDRGWETTHMYPIDVEDLPDGQILPRPKNVRPARRLTMGFRAGRVDLCQPNADNPDVDYRQAETATGFPVATMHDTTRTVEGIIRRAYGSVTPVLLLANIELDTSVGAATKVQQENRTRAWLYGRIQSEPRVTAELGTECLSEFESMDSVTIDEVI